MANYRFRYDSGRPIIFWPSNNAIVVDTAAYMASGQRRDNVAYDQSGKIYTAGFGAMTILSNNTPIPLRPGDFVGNFSAFGREDVGVFLGFPQNWNTSGGIPANGAIVYVAISPYDPVTGQDGRSGSGQDVPRLPDSPNSVAPWSPTATYLVGNPVSYMGVVYYAKANVGPRPIPPPQDTMFWQAQGQGLGVVYPPPPQENRNGLILDPSLLLMISAQADKAAEREEARAERYEAQERRDAIEREQRRREAALEKQRLDLERERIRASMPIQQPLPPLQPMDPPRGRRRKRRPYYG